jgi:hypothetical protein
MSAGPSGLQINTNVSYAQEVEADHASPLEGNHSNGSPTSESDGENTPTAAGPSLATLAGDFGAAGLSDGETTPKVSQNPNLPAGGSSSHSMSLEQLHLQHPPTREQEVQNAVQSGQHQDVVLWHGTSSEAVSNVGKYGTAGGVATKDENKPAPSDAEARRQAGGGSAHATTQTDASHLSEYTTNPGVAAGFGGYGQIMAVQVKTSHLTQGSAAESGWVMNDSAPVKLLGSAAGEHSAAGYDGADFPDAG